MNHIFSEAKNIVEIGMVFLMFVFMIALFLNRYNQERGIGERVIQFTLISLLIPCIIILGIEKVLQGETIATLLGGLGGYVLSAMSKDKNEDKKPKTS